MLNVAVVGVGSIGRHHARNYQAIKGVRLVAVCDLDSKQAADIAKTYQTKYYTNYKKLLEKEKLDAVSVATPTSSHKDVCLQFIKAKIPILVEKPIAPNKKDALKIINEAQKQNVLLTVGHIERFNPAVIKLQQLVDTEALGKILSIVIKRVGLFPPRIKDANVIVDLAIHDIDIARNLIGHLPNSVTAFGGNAFTRKREDYAGILMDFKDCSCFIQANWVTPIKIRSLSLTGSKGFCELDYIKQKLVVYQNKLKSDEFTSFNELINKLNSSKKTVYNPKPKEPLKLELINFINSVEGKEKPVVKISQALEAVIVSEAVCKSIKTKRTVKIQK